MVVTTKKQLFLDLDGVFANFEQHYLDIFGHIHNSISDWKMWRNVNSNENWWTTMLKFEYFDDMWNELKIYNPTIITGCPKTNYEEASIGKKIWAKEHFDENVPVITCLSKDKPLFMKNKGDILIDDMEKNCKRWNEAGGVAIQFFPENWKSVVDTIHEIMNNNEN